MFLVQYKIIAFLKLFFRLLFTLKMIASNKENQTCLQSSLPSSSYSESNESVSLQPSQLAYDSGYNQQIFASEQYKNLTFHTNSSYSINDYERPHNIVHTNETYASFLIPNGMLNSI